MYLTTLNCTLFLNYNCGYNFYNTFKDVFKCFWAQFRLLKSERQKSLMKLREFINKIRCFFHHPQSMFGDKNVQSCFSIHITLNKLFLIVCSFKNCFRVSTVLHFVSKMHEFCLWIFKKRRKMQLKICFFEESHNNYRKKGVLKNFAKLTEKQSCGPED